LLLLNFTLIDQVQPLLVQFQEHPLAWSRVDSIFETSSNPQAKQLALTILEASVRTRWKALPNEQREQIKMYVVNLVIKLSSDPNLLRINAPLVGKLNLVLVEVVKHEWHNWPTFIPDLVNSSRTSECLCANNMNILLILSEEIFDFSAEHMTQAKIKEMKRNLHDQFASIFGLCEYILNHSQDTNLLTITLRTLLRFLLWIPIGYIFETNLIEMLAVRFFPAQIFQNDTLRCLSEIASIQLRDQPPAYSNKLKQMFHSVIDQVSTHLGLDVKTNDLFSSGNPVIQTFLRHMTIFITGCLNQHLFLFESGTDQDRTALFRALNLLLRLSEVDDRVMFKICLEYWSVLVTELYQHQNNGPSFGQGLNLGQLASQQMSSRVIMFAEILSRLRVVMIEQMPRPEEVLIMEDENGQIVRETLKDSDSITLYMNMRECLIFLTHLNPQDTQNTMLSKMNIEGEKLNHQNQADDAAWSWKQLNTLCWAIGSISGAFTEIQEKHFLVKVIRDLLQLCEKKTWQKPQGCYCVEYHVRCWSVSSVSEATLEVFANCSEQAVRIHDRNPPGGSRYGLRNLPENQSKMSQKVCRPSTS